MKRSILEKFVRENLAESVHPDTIVKRLEGHLAHTPAKELLELKHSGVWDEVDRLENQTDAIIRIAAGRVYTKVA